MGHTRRDIRLVSKKIYPYFQPPNYLHEEDTAVAAVFHRLFLSASVLRGTNVYTRGTKNAQAIQVYKRKQPGAGNDFIRW